MVHKRCSAACRRTRRCRYPQRRCLFQEVCWAQPPTALLHWAAAPSRQGLPLTARLLLRQHSRLSGIIHKTARELQRKCVSMRNVTAQELTISWLLYQVRSQVTRPITSLHQQAVMRICMTKQKKNSARQKEPSSSSPAMHHLPGLEGSANPGLQSNHLLMPVCFPMLQQGYHPGINLRRENIYKKPISLGSHFLYSLSCYFWAVGGEKGILIKTAACVPSWAEDVIVCLGHCCVPIWKWMSRRKFSTKYSL